MKFSSRTFVYKVCFSLIINLSMCDLGFEKMKFIQELGVEPLLCGYRMFDCCICHQSMLYYSIKGLGIMLQV